MDEVYKKIYQRAFDNISFVLGIEFDKQCSGFAGDSPIETILFHALQAELMYGIHYPFEAAIVRESSEVALANDCLDNALIVIPQAKIEVFRVDFLVVPGPSSKMLVIECDGHDFHERTKEQAAKDRTRDRRLQELGYTVFRFTGSEIWRDPCKCADQVIEWAKGAYYDTVQPA